MVTDMKVRVSVASSLLGLQTAHDIAHMLDDAHNILANSTRLTLVFPSPYFPYSSWSSESVLKTLRQ
ncbi:hypothetical protein SAMD00019534_063750, partial [Acytostelium subglobosum LB1]|uniref:hypothetical protein n=1 Tax=Acytostelium subglobosum LB1 TaxID=1410327 RepID=UPI000644F811